MIEYTDKEIAKQLKKVVPNLRKLIDGVSRKNQSLSINTKYLNDVESNDFGISILGLIVKYSIIKKVTIIFKYEDN